MMGFDFKVRLTQVRVRRCLRGLGWLASSLVLGAGGAIAHRAVPADSAQVTAIERAIAAPNPSNSTIAQFFYPPADPTPVLRVIGKGQAKLPADFAQLTFEFGMPDRDRGSADPSNSKPEESSTTFSQRYAAATSPVSESALQSILKALLAIGVPKDRIQMTAELGETDKNPLPFPLPFPSKAAISSAKIVVKQSQPTQAVLSKIASTVRSAATGKTDIALKRVRVSYALKDCQALELAVYQSAVQNARNRATAIATALNATLNPVPSVAQPIYDLLFLGCGTGRSFALDSSSEYDPNAAPDVELSREIFVTYTLKN
ncbi:SIMPL domain-containing protein [Altericista sp. CCNU0014]|uniref:SIMPL domain-containing protein n=1 Tax=Altericista sp. CCNU0014 TaxID=3082949 RepID=UPI00384D3535